MKSLEVFRILIVEDNAAWSRKKDTILQGSRESDLEFEHVPTVLAGLQKLNGEKYRALVLGKNVLSRDAVSDVARLRAQFATLPIIVSISREDNGLGPLLLQAGASDYVLNESLELRQLEKTVRFAVERETRKRDLDRAEQRFQELFENAKDIIFTLDLEGNFTSVNNSAVVRQSQKLEAVGRLSGGLAHDFNNLLCVISGHAELLSERLPAEHPGGKNVAQIKKAVDSASTLVRQLLAKAFGGPIHLLLTDVIMPEMGGKELAEQLKSLPPTAKVLYMSGYSDDAIAQSGIRVVEMVFLEKPFTRDILLRKVRRILDEAPRVV